MVIDLHLEPKMLIPLWGLANYILDITRKENRGTTLLILALYNGVLLTALFKLLGI